MFPCSMNSGHYVDNGVRSTYMLDAVGHDGNISPAISFKIIKSKLPQEGNSLMHILQLHCDGIEVL